jgi:xanthine dehydrogenase small subunit
MPAVPAAAAPLSAEPLLQLRVDGADVEVVDEAATLLDVLRDQVGVRSVKDGCSPQGQCGCCTVWVDGAPRVSCVTPVRRLSGRSVTTLDGLPEADRQRWAESLVATGGSQCGFCTPGIIMRLAALIGPVTPVGEEGTAPPPRREKVAQALVAHLCRCTGWQTIEEAASLVVAEAGDDRGGESARDLDQAARRAGLEGGVPQRVGSQVALGQVEFADDGWPVDALVAAPDGMGSYAIAASVAEARRAAGKVQGRSTSLALSYPVPIPPGEWAASLKTTWIEPAYVEPDAAWCAPGGRPTSPFANGGAFGGKLRSPVGADARRLADDQSRPVRVVWSREDVVRFGPKRPPVAGGALADGSGVLTVGVTEGSVTAGQWASMVTTTASVAPGLVLEMVEIEGPPTSFDLRGAVWAEAAALVACSRVAGADTRVLGVGVRDLPVEVVGPKGGRAVARCLTDGAIEVTVDAGDPLDEIVLRSYCIGAVHQALGWVGTEGIAVDDDGTVCDLTVRSFGIVQARAMPEVTVRIEDGRGRPAVNASDSVFAAVAAVRWLADGLPQMWPTHRGGARG